MVLPSHNRDHFCLLVAEVFPFCFCCHNWNHRLAVSLVHEHQGFPRQTCLSCCFLLGLHLSSLPWFMGSALLGRGLQVSDLTTLDSSPCLTRGQAWVLCCSVNLTFWVCMMWTAAVSVVPSLLVLRVFTHKTLAYFQFLCLCFPCCPQCDNVFQESVLWANLCIHDSSNVFQSQSDFVNLKYDTNV